MMLTYKSKLDKCKAYQPKHVRRLLDHKFSRNKVKNMGRSTPYVVYIYVILLFPNLIKIFLRHFRREFTFRLSTFPVKHASPSKNLTR